MRTVISSSPSSAVETIKGYLPCTIRGRTDLGAEVIYHARTAEDVAQIFKVLIRSFEQDMGSLSKMPAYSISLVATNKKTQEGVRAVYISQPSSTNEIH